MTLAFAALLIWILLQGLTVVGVLNYLHHLPRDRKIAGPSGIVVILSVRDDWDGGPALIAALRAQDGAPFRLILATSGYCPAAAALALAQPDWIDMIAAGYATGEGQKVHKLRAAFAALRPDDAYVVLIDADILPPPRLVGRLVFPLERGKAEIATGYRLLLPANLLLGLVGAVEMQLATLPRPANGTMPWGGAMAIRRDALDRFGFADALVGRLSDDLGIGLHARANGMRMRPVRDLLVATPLDGGIADTLAFGVRQYRHVRTNSATMWSIATLVVALQSLGWGWALLAGGWPAILIGYAAAWIRCLGRNAILSSILDPFQCRAARRSLLWDAAAPFLVLWAHLAVQLAAVCSSRIRWGGYDYWIQRGRVIRMARVDTA